MLKKTVLYLLLFIGAWALSTCSTKKNTFVSRSYHNLTSHYNAYFNGNESFKEGYRKVDKALVDDFTNYLPVFTYGDENTAQSVLPEMDKAIKKSSKVIKIHSITVKPKRRQGAKRTLKQKAFYEKKEFCKWVDNSYLLLGKAQFYKHDFFSAREAFEFIITEFSGELIKFDAMLWLARTNNELGKYKESLEILQRTQGDNLFPSKLKGEISAIYADLYMKQKKYADAIPHLESAIDKPPNKRSKARYKYILAQIYQNQGQFDKASSLYSDVIKLNPPYEMAFNAKINRARSFDIEHSDPKAIKKQLTKMLKDDKNIEYQDQIYYALGNVEFKEGNIESSIACYKKSIGKSVSNTTQKALSYLAIADIYYSNPSKMFIPSFGYKMAGAYYDSAVNLLDNKYLDYEKVKAKAKNLGELVEYIYAVERQDSLRKIAGMKPDDRNRFIDELIQKVKEEEEQKREEEIQRQLNIQQFNQNKISSVNQKSTAGKWYFYNPSTVGIGQTEFAKKWGKRSLEDNWRRKSKIIVDISQTDNLTMNDSSNNNNKKITLNNKSREYYIKDLPLNDSLMDLSHKKTIEALYRLGRTYKEKFFDFSLSIQAFEDLIRLYPDNEYILQSYYELYELYTLTKNNVNAEKYKNLIITKFPDSKYARLLKDPEYIHQLSAEKEKVNLLYSETYTYFISGNFHAVIERCTYADSLYSNDPLMPKFAYLNAIASGKISGIMALNESLKKLTTEYPDDEVTKNAKTILENIKNGKYSDILASSDNLISKEEKTKMQDDLNKIIKDEKEKQVSEAEELYTFNEKAEHFYFILVENKKTDMNRLKFSISNFNIDYFSMYDFDVGAILLNEEFQVVTVKSFENKEKATAYFQAVKANNVIYKDLKENSYRHFIISADNYPLFYKDKNITRYITFFDKYYSE